MLFGICIHFINRGSKDNCLMSSNKTFIEDFIKLILKWLKKVLPQKRRAKMNLSEYYHVSFLSV